MQGKSSLSASFCSKYGGHHHESDSHYLRVYVGHLRKKLNEDPTNPRYIQTEPGIGYRFLLPTE